MSTGSATYPKAILLQPYATLTDENEGNDSGIGFVGLFSGLLVQG